MQLDVDVSQLANITRSVLESLGIPVTGSPSILKGYRKTGSSG